MTKPEEVFLAYAAAFEEAYADDNWERLRDYFDPMASYAVEGGPLACEIFGIQGILHGLQRSVNGLDRRCDERRLELTDGPSTVPGDDGDEVHVRWEVSYVLGDSPRGGLTGRSMATVRDGRISRLVDYYEDSEIARFGAWMAQYAPDLDGSYIPGG